MTAIGHMGSFGATAESSGPVVVRSPPQKEAQVPDRRTVVAGNRCAAAPHRVLAHMSRKESAHTNLVFADSPIGGHFEARNNGGSLFRLATQLCRSGKSSLGSVSYLSTREAVIACADVPFARILNRHSASDDFAQPDKVRVILKDIRETRQSKIRQGLAYLNPVSVGVSARSNSCALRRIFG